MKDISYHILDIVQNSLNAGATRIVVEMIEKTSDRCLTLRINDNGKGMDQEQLKRVIDPFFTSSVNKKVGLGIPLLKQNAEISGGSFNIISEVNKGTMVEASFNTGNIDMIPMGDIALSIRLLVASNPGLDFCYRYSKDSRCFELDTAEMRKELGDIKLNRKEVLDFISESISSHLKNIELETN